MKVPGGLNGTHQTPACPLFFFTYGSKTYTCGLTDNINTIFLGKKMQKRLPVGLRIISTPYFLEKKSKKIYLWAYG